MKREYPRIGIIHKVKRHGNCRICGKNECDRAVEIEFNHMRGDDEIYQVHQVCIIEKSEKEILQAVLP